MDMCAKLQETNTDIMGILVVWKYNKYFFNGRDVYLQREESGEGLKSRHAKQLTRQLQKASTQISPDMLYTGVRHVGKYSPVCGK